MATAAAKASTVRRLRSRSSSLGSRSLYARVASSASRSSANAAEALPRAHRQESSMPPHARAYHCPVPTPNHAQSAW
eukprot:scaffold32480_cov68-Phaeocystis_antarctica.AAC.6